MQGEVCARFPFLRTDSFEVLKSLQAIYKAAAPVVAQCLCCNPFKLEMLFGTRVRLIRFFSSCLVFGFQKYLVCIFSLQNHENFWVIFALQASFGVANRLDMSLENGLLASSFVGYLCPLFQSSKCSLSKLVERNLDLLK